MTRAEATSLDWTAVLSCSGMRFTEGRLQECKFYSKVPDLSRIAAAERCEFHDCSMNGIDWSHVSLVDSNLTECHLEDASLAQADLTRVKMRGCALNRSILDNATLTDADLSEAQLQGASLLGVDAFGANLSDAFLEGADLTGARLDKADFSGAVLRNAIVSKDELHDVIWDDRTVFPWDEVSLENATED
jgi:uncharacterized protein YjbI with pentapeptide repeats